MKFEQYQVINKQAQLGRWKVHEAKKKGGGIKYNEAFLLRLFSDLVN